MVEESVVQHREQDNRGEQGKGDFAPYDAAFGRERMNHGGHAEYQKNVGDVASHDVSNDEVGAVIGPCEERDNEFWEGGAEGDDRQADDEVRNVQPSRDRRGAGHQVAGPFDKKEEPDA